jgi:hypothetical protein
MNVATYLSSLKGKTIASVENLTQADIDEMMWCCDPSETIVLMFTDGSGAVVMADPEGNDTGFLELFDGVI